MSDYDAIYQAFSNELSYLRPYVTELFAEAQRPSVLFRPTIQPDGNQWCALYGKNLHDGVAGWAITLAGEAGKKMEREYGPAVAGRMIYLASTGRAPHFYATNDRALEDIKACAAEQAL